MKSMAGSMVIVVVLAGVSQGADSLPFVLGGDGGGGKVPAVAPPPCPGDSIFAQEGPPSNGSYSVWTSESGSGWVVSDNFWGVTEDICGVRWWGMLTSNVFTDCDEIDHTFAITLYQDTGGGPGAVVDSFDVLATRTDRSADYFPGIYEYRASFPHCVSLSSGWISVAGRGDPNCWFWWLVSPHGDGGAFQTGAGLIPDDLAMCLVTSPSCPGGSLSSQRPNSFNGAASDADVALPGEYLVFENFPAGGGSLSEPICDLRWWGTYDIMGNPCSESQDTFEIKFYQDDMGQPGDEVYCYRVVADRQETDFTVPYGDAIYEFGVGLPSCCPMASGWISIQGYGGNTDCWHIWIMSLDGDGVFYRYSGSTMHPDGPGLSLCLTTKPDGDGDLVPDDLDDCPGTARGDPVDADGCSTEDDDGDGVLNDADHCPGTPTCATVDADGCPSDGDDDGVADGCDDCAGTAAGDPVDAGGCSTADEDGDGVLNDADDCPETPSCATNVDTNGCAIDSDGDGNVDGCEPPAQEGGCCGATGPAAPLGLAIGMLLLGRLGRSRRNPQPSWSK